MKAFRDGLAWLVVLWQICYVRMVWDRLPALLPSHFGVDGQANRYAGRGVLWVLVGASAFICLLLTVLELLPRVFNLRAPVGSPDRSRQEALAVAMLGWIRVEVVLTFAYLLWAVVQVGEGRKAGLGVAFSIVPMVIIVLTVVGFLVRMTRNPNSVA